MSPLKSCWGSPGRRPPRSRPGTPKTFQHPGHKGKVPCWGPAGKHGVCPEPVETWPTTPEGGSAGQQGSAGLGARYQTRSRPRSPAVH